MQINKRNVLAGSVGVVAGVLGGVGSSFAALPTEATAAITAIQTDGLAMQAAGWPVLAAIVGGFILMKLFKKTANRAS